MFRSRFVAQVHARQRPQAAQEAQDTASKKDPIATTIQAAENRLQKAIDKLHALDFAETCRSRIASMADKRTLVGLDIDSLKRAHVPIFDAMCTTIEELPRLLRAVKDFMSGRKLLKTHLQDRLKNKSFRLIEDEVVPFAATKEAEATAIGTDNTPRFGGYTATNFVEFVDKHKSDFEFSTATLMKLLKIASDAYKQEAASDDAAVVKNAKERYAARCAALDQAIACFVYVKKTTLLILEVADEKWHREKKK